ncbi:unnamed protein product [Fusarium fujikuroi]|uniref:Uncharacterized protein n=1 Tax=Fusarium fujikuroi TaxID=5127 RepID=A0A2H3S2X3_FUSFU|nr:uncharacterized protein FFC1_11021 [Fusarium fujikuroi]SCO21816.1 uncharacterized protein FFE2_15041 [Fusarium fujikuroi]SCV60760.1 uncharacterized protein FFFS_15329 [Fusarium fujikuroi]VTT64701.1 unnamed protein product [Fusarium fujikuroi]VTT74080.1 unnamed protein product [Fusarium fujikuroi]
MRALDVLDLIIVLEALLCIAMICNHLHTAYKYMERKRRIKNNKMRNWDGLDDKNLEMGWGADSSGTSSPC